MWDIVEGLHKALRIESTWAFVLVVAGGSALIGGGIAWIIDAGYKNSSEYKTEHPDPKFQAAASMSAQTLTATPQQSVSQAAPGQTPQAIPTVKHKQNQQKKTNIPASIPTATTSQPSNQAVPPNSGIQFSNNLVVGGTALALHQGSGSAVSINQQGGVTAGTINYAPPDRRLTDDQKTDLEKCLKTNPGSFLVVAMSGSGKAYRYAQDWSEVFSGAGWTNENPIPVGGSAGGSGDWSGLRIGFAATWDDASKSPSFKEGSPGMSAYQCIGKLRVLGGIIPRFNSDQQTGRVLITVGDD